MPISSKRRTYALHCSPLYKLGSRSKLAGLLGISNGDLRRLCRAPETLYVESERPKKNGTGTRLIENPARPLKLVQASIARLLGRIKPPDYLFCPVKGRCYVGNAARHRGNRVIRCLDVRKYFPSTRERRVFWFFNTVMGCSRDVAAILAALSSYKGHLPTGSPLSPIMAYFAHIDVWEAVAAICKANGYTLTVYIDDVTISGQKISPEAIWEIKKTIHRVGLRYHKEKVYRDRPAEITGVIVDGTKLRAPQRNLKRAKSFQVELKASGTDDERKRATEKLNGVRGQLAQISKIAQIDHSQLCEWNSEKGAAFDPLPKLVGTGRVTEPRKGDSNSVLK